MARKETLGGVLLPAAEMPALGSHDLASDSGEGRRGFIVSESFSAPALMGGQGKGQTGQQFHQPALILPGNQDGEAQHHEPKGIELFKEQKAL